MSHGPSSSPAPAPFVPRGRRDKNRLAELRAGWGRPVKRERPTETVALYHRRSAVAGATVDDTTWSDLALEDFFGVLDRTGGMPGRQVLYHRLRTYETDPAVLAERTRQHEVFRRDAAARERIQLIAARLDGPGAAYMAPLLLDPLPI